MKTSSKVLIAFGGATLVFIVLMAILAGTATIV